MALMKHQLLLNVGIRLWSFFHHLSDTSVSRKMAKTIGL